jgi:tRNA A37 threonylcarbamoyladenosine modification protein TsaB
MVKLYIDSSKIEEVIVKLISEDFEEIVRTQTKSVKGSQVILATIQKVLEKKKKSLKDITEIEVYEGEGSYTGRRVGASIANSLSYALSLPINAKKIGVFVYPSYE